MVLWQRGLRVFTVASALAMLIGVLHTLGLANEPPNHGWAAALDAMRAATMNVAGMEMTFWSVYAAVWIQVGVLMVMLGGKNLLVVSIVPAGSVHRAARILSVFDVVFYAFLVGLVVYYQILAPLVAFAVLTIAFLAAAVFAKPVTTE